jgi:flagellar basal-body rod modification protein FlgD
VIRYQLDKAGAVSFKIVNVSGQLVQSVNLGLKNAGEYSIQWDGKNQSGVRVPSGVYFYQVSAKVDDGVLRSEVKKMVLLE